MRICGIQGGGKTLNFSKFDADIEHMDNYFITIIEEGGGGGGVLTPSLDPPLPFYSTLFTMMADIEHELIIFMRRHLNQLYC